MSYEAVLPGSEYDNWEDRGCNLAPHCLSCPLPDGCKYDMPAKHAIAVLHWLTIAPLIDAGMTPTAIGKATGLHRRTVHRLKNQASAGAFNG